MKGPNFQRKLLLDWRVRHSTLAITRGKRLKAFSHWGQRWRQADLGSARETWRILNRRWCHARQPPINLSVDKRNHQTQSADGSSAPNSPVSLIAHPTQDGRFDLFYSGPMSSFPCNLCLSLSNWLPISFSVLFLSFPLRCFCIPRRLSKGKFALTSCTTFWK